MCAVHGNLHLTERIFLPIAWQQTVLVLGVAVCFFDTNFQLDAGLLC